jgi:hypothetical protein
VLLDVNNIDIWGRNVGLLLLCWQNKIDEDLCVVRAPRWLGAADGCCPAGDAA